MFLFKQSSKFPLAIIIISFLLTACGGGGGGSAQPVSGASASALSVERQYVAERIYRDERFPADFRFPKFWGDSSNCIIVHVKSTDVLLFAKMPEIPAFELSTDSWEEAITWSEEAAQKLPVYYDLVDLKETDMYFEMIRMNPELPDVTYHSLVFKNSFIDRSEVDLDNPGPHRGYVSLNFLTSEHIDSVLEHLFLSSGHNQYGYAVLEDGSEELGEEFKHTMIEAELVVGAGSCDTIRVFEVVHHISKITGEMTADSVRDLYDFRAVVDANGNVTACGGRV